MKLLPATECDQIFSWLAGVVRANDVPSTFNAAFAQTRRPAV